MYHSDAAGNTDAPYLSVDGTFIVLEATETVNVDHAVVTMKVSNIDRQPIGAIEILMQVIQKLETHSLKPNIVQGAPTAYVYDREIAPGLPAEVPIEFTDSTLELNRCRLRLKTSPLRTTAVDALDVPSHQHEIANNIVGREFAGRHRPLEFVRRGRQHFSNFWQRPVYGYWH